MKEGDLVEQRLRQKPQTRIGKNGLAEDMKLSRFQLYRRVKAQAGISPKQLAGKHRIEQACVLLKETPHSVAAIGLEVGIDDANYFTRFFKLHTGHSPREWRKQFAHAGKTVTKATAAPAPRVKASVSKVEEDLPVHLL